jgi:uncharacterized repeat protein (TIGR03843 family)
LSAVTRHAASPAAAPALLEHGLMEVLGILPNASNYTFLVRLRLGREAGLAVYKPEAGESPLWDFPDGTLARREVAAWEVAAALGWPDVPSTVLRDGPHGRGSVQRFVDLDPEEHFFTLRDRRLADFRAVAIFDAVVNNADRKAGHCLLGADGRIWLIDHGVCFNIEPKLRTVIWDFADEPIEEALLESLGRLRSTLATGGLLRERLGPLLQPREIEAIDERAGMLIATGRFPLPDASRRHFPWPPV